MINNIEDSSLTEDNNSYDNNTNNYGSADGSGSLGKAEEDQQLSSKNADNEDKEVVSDDDEKDTTLQAGERALNPTGQKLAGDRRDVSRAPARANDATDPNDTGSGGISAGGVKSGSSLQ